MQRRTMNLRPKQAPATYADLEALADGTRAEIMAGEIIVQPRPKPRHSKTVRALGSYIGGPYDDDDGDGGPGGWWILPEVDIALAGDPTDYLAPDISGWRRERLVNLNEQPIMVVPDWICEVISPSTSERDTKYKYDAYLAAGVGYYWLAHPSIRALEAYKRENNSWRLLGVYEAGACVAIEPFELVALEISRLFFPVQTP